MSSERTERTQDSDGEESSAGGGGAAGGVALWEGEEGWGKLVFCALLWLTSQLATAAAVAVNQDLVWRSPLVSDLAGLWVRLSPEGRRAGRWAGDAAVLVTTAAVLALLLVHRARWLVLRRHLFLTATLSLLRTVCLCATQLPPASPESERECSRPLRPVSHRMSNILIVHYSGLFS